MKNYLRILATLAVCMLVLTAFTAVFSHSVGNLVHCSQPLVNVKGWWRADGPDRPYAWLTDTSLFSHSGWWRLSAPFTYNLTTRTKTPLNKLQKLLGSDGDDQTNFWELSPDHQYIAWNIECYNTVHTAILDGREHRTWDLEGPGYGNCVSNLTWLADGHRWAASTIDYYSGKDKLACIGDLEDNSQKLVSVPDDETDPLALAQAVAKVEDGSYAVEQQASTGGSYGKVAWTSIQPPAGNVAEVEASPDHKHLAWLVIDQHTPMPAQLIHRLVPAYYVARKRSNSLWISNFDGSNSREVGRVEAVDCNDIRSIQWMPDENRVSYIYNEQIYAVDVRDCM